MELAMARSAPILNFANSRAGKPIEL